MLVREQFECLKVPHTLLCALLLSAGSGCPSIGQPLFFEPLSHLQKAGCGLSQQAAVGCRCAATVLAEPSLVVDCDAYLRGRQRRSAHNLGEIAGLFCAKHVQHGPI